MIELPRRPRGLLVGLAALVSLVPSVTHAVAPPPCIQVHVAVDTSLADTTLKLIDGRGCGQVVMAQDTVVNSVTFWLRARVPVFTYSAILYVTPVDSLGTPDVSRVLYTSPRQTGTIGGASYLEAVKVAIAPPLILPGSGSYYFNISEASCLGTFLVAGHHGDAYGGGIAWKTGTTLCLDNGPGGPTGPDPNMDFIFDVEFCDTHSTPVLRRSWGEIKQIYR